MVRIAAATVAIGMAVMIVSLGVISGFREAITAKLTGFGGDVQIVHLDGNVSFETEPIFMEPILESNISRLQHFRSIYPFAVKGGILRTDSAMEGILLKGYDHTYDWEFFRRNLLEGELPRMEDSVRYKEMLVSSVIAGRTGISVGDRVEMLFFHRGTAPRRDRFKVSGIYSTGLEEMDRITVATDLRSVQRVSGWEADQITGYEVTTTDFSRIDRFAEDVFSTMLGTELEYSPYLMVLDIRDRFPNLFDWLAAHNVNGVVILTIMLIVSILNMISALLIILLERTRMIGLLKALGMPNRRIRILFLIRSSYIILWGLLWGNIAGVGISLLQKYTGLIKLNESGYFLPVVPIDIVPWHIAALNVCTIALLLAVLTVPTIVISRIYPAKTLTYTQ